MAGWLKARAWAGQAIVGRNQTVTDGEAYQVWDIVQSKLLHNIGTVSLHGFDAQDEAVGDLLAGVALGDQSQDLQLARTEHTQLIGQLLRLCTMLRLVSGLVAFLSLALLLYRVVFQVDADQRASQARV